MNPLLFRGLGALSYFFYFFLIIDTILGDPETGQSLIVILYLPLMVWNTYIVYSSFKPDFVHDDRAETAAANASADRSLRE